METKESNIRGWIMVLFFSLSMVVMTLNILVFSACATDAELVYGFNQVQLTTISSVTSVVSVFGGFLFGRMLDKGNVRRNIILFLAIGVVLFFLRATLTSYVPILVVTFLASLCCNICLVAGPKVIATWFPQEKTGAATSFVFSAAGIGFVLAFSVGAMLGVKKTVLSVAIIYLVMLIIWIAIGKEGPYKTTAATDANTNTEEKVDTMRVYKSKNLWCVIIAYSLVVTSSTLVNNYMINSFVSKGLESSQASAMGTVLNLGLVIGGYVMTSILAVVKRFNPLFAICMLGSTVFILAGWFLPIGTITWICVAFGGLIFGGAVGLCAGRVPLLPQTGDFGMESIGAASGFNEAVKGFISFILPIIVANLCGTNYTAIFIIFAVCCVVAMIFGSVVIPELGENRKKK